MTEVFVLIRLAVKPQCIDAFRLHTLQLAHAVRAERPCLDIQVLEPQAQPAQFVLLEHWADKDYYLSDSHQQSAHMQAYLEATQRMIADVGVEVLVPAQEAPVAQVHDDAA